MHLGTCGVLMCPDAQVDFINRFIIRIHARKARRISGLHSSWQRATRMRGDTEPWADGLPVFLFRVFGHLSHPIRQRFKGRGSRQADQTGKQRGRCKSDSESGRVCLYRAVS